MSPLKIFDKLGLSSATNAGSSISGCVRWGLFVTTVAGCHHIVAWADLAATSAVVADCAGSLVVQMLSVRTGCCEEREVNAEIAE